jgi:hypothetical protein
MSDYFAGVDRGKALRGSKAIAQYAFQDEEASEIISRLPRAEFGLLMLGRDLVGYTGWLDHALAARAQDSKSRRRRAATKEIKATSKSKRRTRQREVA